MSGVALILLLIRIEYCIYDSIGTCQAIIIDINHEFENIQIELNQKFWWCLFKFKIIVSTYRIV